MNQNFIITVGRQLGSGGRLVAEKLAHRLGVAFYDKELIERASSESGVACKFFEQADEKFNPTLSVGWLGEFFQDNYFSNESFFQMQSEVILKIAATESAVIVGRCADYVLRDYPNIVSVFISGDLNDRIARVCEYQQVSPDKALHEIEKTDKKRAAFYNYFSNKTWGVAASYDLCVNSSVLGVDATVEVVLNFLKQKIKVE